MYKGRARRIIAWGLLVVFTTMMVFTSFHHHHYVMVDDGECVQCTHHLPHSGHISWHSLDTHNCLVCQLSQTPYLTNDSQEMVTYNTISELKSFFSKEDIRAPPLVLLMA